MSDKVSKYDKRYLAAVDAAAAVFAEKGYHGAGTQDIADKLDIKQGSLYYYFKSKEAALEAVCLEGIKHQVEFLHTLADSDFTLSELVTSILKYTLTSLPERVNYIKVFDEERQSIPLERRGSIREQSQRYHHLLIDLFDRAATKGELKPNLEVQAVVRAFTGLLSSVYAWYYADNSIELDKVVHQYAELFLSGAVES